MDFKKIAGGLFLVIGVFAFILSIYNNNLNFALIYLTAALILWVLYSLILDVFDFRFFAWIISVSGFLVAISVFFMFGIEEVPYPVGAIVFHSEGLAGALGIGFFALFPILILHKTGSEKLPQITRTESVMPREEMEPEIENNEWEMASDDDLQSGEFEVG
jgi:hypothetical protein